MKHNFLFRSLLLVGFLCVGLQAQIGVLAKKTDSITHPDVTNEIDKEVFLLIKGELDIAKKLLIEIRNSQNPALIKSAVYSLGSVLKELMYILGAVTLGGGCTVAGIGLIIGEGNLTNILNNPMGQGATLIALPAVIFSIILTYAFLKSIFGWLASDDKDQTGLNVKEALMHIDQTINKLDYEIKKIERLYKSQRPV